MKALQKTVTFRILATVATACVAWYATGNYNVGATIGVGTAITNSTLYYFHEKAWEDKPKEPKQPKLHKYHKKYGVDNL